MQNIRILVVEDEEPIRKLIKINLQRVNYIVDEASCFKEARARLNSNNPDLIILDWMLPDTSGLKLAENIRSNHKTKDTPIIMVTARGEEEDRVTGLKTGCDDYLIKPFYPSELIARIQAILRRTKITDIAEFIKIGNLIINNASKRVSANGQLIHLGPTEYRLLSFLARRPERVFSRSSLLDGVWPDNVYVDDRTIDVHIRRIRKALAPHNYDYLIHTVRGSGYMFSNTNNSINSNAKVVTIPT